MRFWRRFWKKEEDSQDDSPMFVGSEAAINRLSSRAEILEAFKKEKGIENPENLPMPEFLAFRKELFERYRQAGV